MLSRIFIGFTMGVGALGGCGHLNGVDAGSWVREPSSRFTLVFRPDDREQAHRARRYAELAAPRLEGVLAASASRPFDLVVYPDRASMVNRWRQAWNQPDLQSQCWMVAAGWAVELSMLSPRVWGTEACGHDGTDSAHVAHLVGHELVHVVHGQVNPSYPALTGAAPWLTEGLAVYVSGQWDSEYAVLARRAAGQPRPTSVPELWATGGYPLAGALMAFLVDSRGASILRETLLADSWPGALELADTTEADLILRLWSWLANDDSSGHLTRR